MYERKAGYNGKQHGEIKLSTPAPKAKKRFTSSNNFHPHAKSYIHSIKIWVKNTFIRTGLFYDNIANK